MAFWIDRLHLPAAILSMDSRLPVAYLATCLLFAMPLAFQGSTAQPGAEFVSAVMDNGRGDWHQADIQTLTLPRGRISTLKMRVLLDPAIIASNEPLGLYLSGTFSATALWNGVPLGKKGQPGVSRADEQPGLVDTVLPLPARLLRPGENELTLRLSANYLVHPVYTVIHGRGASFGLRVAPFSAEARRPIGYYAAPFLMSAVLLVGLVILGLRGQMRSSGDDMANVPYVVWKAFSHGPAQLGLSAPLTTQSTRIALTCLTHPSNSRRQSRNDRRYSFCFSDATKFKSLQS